MRAISLSTIFATLLSAGLLAAGAGCGGGGSDADADGDGDSDADADADADGDGDADADGDGDGDSDADADADGDGDADADADGDTAGDAEADEEAPPDDPDPVVPTRLTFATDAQDQPKVAALRDGGAWVSWYGAGGSMGEQFRMHLEHVAPDGHLLFADEGARRLGDEPSDSWVSDYDLGALSDGSAIVAFPDMRWGTWDVQVYRVNLDGSRPWGVAGLTLSRSADRDEMTPQLVVTPGDDTVVAWISATEADTVVGVQRIEPDGVLTWDTQVTITGRDATMFPRVVRSVDEDVIVLWYDEVIVGMSVTASVIARRIDATGASVWPEDVVLATDESVPPGQPLQVATDGEGGVWAAWGYGLGGLESYVHVQGVTAGGELVFGAGPLDVSTSVVTDQFSPRAAADEQTSGVVVFFQDGATGASRTAVMAQLVTADGEREWGDFGVIVVPMSELNWTPLDAAPVPGGAVLLQPAVPAVGSFAAELSAYSVASAGAAGRALSVSGPGSAAGRGDVDWASPLGAWAAWSDSALDPGDIYVVRLPELP